jgi:hypothetical protein
MDLVLADDLARFQPAHDVRAPMFEGRAEFHAAECAYQSALDLSLGGARARDLLLIRPRVAQELDGQSLLLKRFDARLLKANERLLNALASVDDSRSVEELTADIQKQVQWSGRKVRGLRPWAEDKELLTAINQGDFLINGFRNRVLQKAL